MPCAATSFLFLSFLRIGLLLRAPRTLGFVLLLCCLWGGPAHAAPQTKDTLAAGMVLAVTPEAWAEEDSQSKIALALKMPVNVRQSVSTGEKGKAQLLFTDDSHVSLAPLSRVDIKDFAFSPTKSVLDLNLTTGLARIVSGEVVRRNPVGFTVRTPDAHIGVRGTTLSVARKNKRTTVVLTETSGGGGGHHQSGRRHPAHIEPRGLCCGY